MNTAFQKEIMDLLGISSQQALSVPEELEHKLYSTAFGLYERGDWTAASELFTQLVLTDPFCQDYWRALAGSKQMAKDYLGAVHAWGLVALLKEEDPLPHFHAAECFLSMNEKQEAIKALDAALQFCKEESLFNKIHLLKKIHDSTY